MWDWRTAWNAQIKLWEGPSPARQPEPAQPGQPAQTLNVAPSRATKCLKMLETLVFVALLEGAMAKTPSVVGIWAVVVQAHFWALTEGEW